MLCQLRHPGWKRRAEIQGFCHNRKRNQESYPQGVWLDYYILKLNNGYMPCFPSSQHKTKSKQKKTKKRLIKGGPQATGFLFLISIFYEASNINNSAKRDVNLANHPLVCIFYNKSDWSYFLEFFKFSKWPSSHPYLLPWPLHPPETLKKTRL